MAKNYVIANAVYCLQIGVEKADYFINESHELYVIASKISISPFEDNRQCISVKCPIKILRMNIIDPELLGICSDFKSYLIDYSHDGQFPVVFENNNI